MATISELLGYSDDSKEPTLTPARLVSVNAIKARLAAIDAQLAESLPDSMAVKVGDLEVDYKTYQAMLRSEGSRLLKQLAAIAGLALKYNCYMQAQPLSIATPDYIR